MATATTETTETAKKPKAILTSKLMADGRMKTVASKLILNRLWAAHKDAVDLGQASHLKEKAQAAIDAITELIAECSE